MSASVGLFVATALFVSVGWDTEDTMGFQLYMEQGMGSCLKEEDALRHLRLLDAAPCQSKIFFVPVVPSIPLDDYG